MLLLKHACRVYTIGVGLCHTSSSMLLAKPLSLDLPSLFKNSRSRLALCFVRLDAYIIQKTNLIHLSSTLYGMDIISIVSNIVFNDVYAPSVYSNQRPFLFAHSFLFADRSILERIHIVV